MNTWSPIKPGRYGTSLQASSNEGIRSSNYSELYSYSWIDCTLERSGYQIKNEVAMTVQPV